MKPLVLKEAFHIRTDLCNDIDTGNDNVAVDRFQSVHDDKDNKNYNHII